MLLSEPLRRLRCKAKEISTKIVEFPTLLPLLYVLIFEYFFKTKRDDPCIVAGAQGVAQVDKASFIKMMQHPTYTLNAFKIGEDVEMKMISNDVAVLAYSVHEDLTVDGRQVSIDASEASTWVRKEGKWLCALHTESLLGDPYGRDKKTPLDS